VSYALLDSGHGRKLERVGAYLLDRQAAQAHWRPRLPRDAWQRADAVHVRSDTGGGHWEERRKLPERWGVELEGVRAHVKLTPFGHLGLFAEHASHWPWLRRCVESALRSRAALEVLNLFAYTGGPSVACAQAGARVTHVDAARGIVDWARENAALNGLAEKPIRWIVEDCTLFLQREVRRGRRYDAVILDPPSFGRGAKGQVFKIESDLEALLDLCAELLGPKPAFALFSCHTPGFSPLVLENLLAERFERAALAVESSEMAIAELESGRRLPAGSYTRWWSAG
jgi:23S rRNA (cytosine1962-C5)-methyltransferase